MSLGIRKHILDFEILDTGNPYTVVFMDSSQYYTEPERPLLEVTLPGYSKYFLLNVAARQVNTFNSNTIGLTEIFNSFNLVSLPDGVWTFKFKVCPYDKVYIQKYHLRTVDLENKLCKIYDQISMSDCDVARDEKLNNTLVEIFLATAAGKAHAKEGNARRASELYQLANESVNRLLNNLTGVC